MFLPIIKQWLGHIYQRKKVCWFMVAIWSKWLKTAVDPVLARHCRKRWVSGDIVRRFFSLHCISCLLSRPVNIFLCQWVLLKCTGTREHFSLAASELYMESAVCQGRQPILLHSPRPFSDPFVSPPKIQVISIIICHSEIEPTWRVSFRTTDNR